MKLSKMIILFVLALKFSEKREKEKIDSNFHNSRSKRDLYVDYGKTENQRNIENKKTKIFKLNDI